MNKIIVATILLFISTLTSFSQVFDKQCYYGISFERSTNWNWGYGELIITEVEPHSPAEEAGIKVNDIIMEINGRATYLRDHVTIAEWLFNNPNPVVKFTIRNIDAYFKEYTLHRECITVNSINERNMANIFSFYSLENVRQQQFTLPLEVNPMEYNPEVAANYTDFHTFDFYDSGQKAEDSALDRSIKRAIEKEMLKKGIKKDKANPDIWVNIYYEYAANTMYSTPASASGSLSHSNRYNCNTQKMEKLPIYPVDEKNIIKKGKFTASLGIIFLDTKYIEPVGDFTKIWEVKIKDYLSLNMSMDEYAAFHIPLMFMQYPYTNAKKQSEYVVHFNRYNYTGMHYNANDMQTVNDVEINSPAFKAGVRAGYTINKIDKDKFGFSKEEITNAYRQFVDDTNKYREQNTQFAGADGYKEYMFWDEHYYKDIAKEFRKSKYITNFSYLFDFEKYVTPGYNGTMQIEGWDGIQKRIFTVRPLIKESVTIKAAY